MITKPYYDKENIQVFSEPSEIDFQWCLSEKDVQHENIPDFSAKCLLEFLKNFEG